MTPPSTAFQGRLRPSESRFAMSPDRSAVLCCRPATRAISSMAYTSRASTSGIARHPDSRSILQRTGLESVDDLNNDQELKSRLESIRLAAGPLMNLGDVTDRVVPKMSLIAPAIHGGSLHDADLHSARLPLLDRRLRGRVGGHRVPVAGFGCGWDRQDWRAGAAVAVDRSIPLGEFTVYLDADRSPAMPRIRCAGLLRTARMLFDGMAFCPCRLSRSE